MFLSKSVMLSNLKQGSFVVGVLNIIQLLSWYIQHPIHSALCGLPKKTFFPTERHMMGSDHMQDTPQSIRNQNADY